MATRILAWCLAGVLAGMLAAWSVRAPRAAAARAACAVRQAEAAMLAAARLAAASGEIVLVVDTAAGRIALACRGVPVWEGGARGPQVLPAAHRVRAWAAATEPGVHAEVRGPHLVLRLVAPRAGAAPPVYRRALARAAAAWAPVFYPARLPRPQAQLDIEIEPEAALAILQALRPGMLLLFDRLGP